MTLHQHGIFELALTWRPVIKQNPQIFTSNHYGKFMNLSMHIGPIAALIAGVLILLIPRLLNYIVAIYLIVIGLIGLFGTGSLRI